MVNTDKLAKRLVPFSFGKEVYRDSNMASYQAVHDVIACDVCHDSGWALLVLATAKFVFDLDGKLAVKDDGLVPVAVPIDDDERGVILANCWAGVGRYLVHSDEHYNSMMGFRQPPRVIDMQRQGDSENVSRWLKGLVE